VNLPENIVVAALALAALLIVLVPFSLRIAGLSGQQIMDTISLTLQFFINLVREFRAQNKSP